MELIGTYIENLFIIQTDIYSDSRGAFYRTYCKSEFEKMEVHDSFIQSNISHNIKKGQVRGMHMQIPPYAESKIVRCVRGKIFDVAVDLRKGSSTFLRYYGIELTAENGLALIIPEGFAHGFQVLEEESTMLYMHSVEYKPEYEFSISCQDPKIGIVWPFEVIGLSEKDHSVKFLDDGFEGIEL
ncbi:MAG: dTDP-4-dehydrorhamnose 3,5-epimerase [Saprospiraceae bacterium]